MPARLAAKWPGAVWAARAASAAAAACAASEPGAASGAATSHFRRFIGAAAGDVGTAAGQPGRAGAGECGGGAGKRRRGACGPRQRLADGACSVSSAGHPGAVLGATWGWGEALGAAVFSSLRAAALWARRQACSALCQAAIVPPSGDHAVVWPPGAAWQMGSARRSPALSRFPKRLALHVWCSRMAEDLTFDFERTFTDHGAPGGFQVSRARSGGLRRGAWRRPGHLRAAQRALAAPPPLRRRRRCRRWSAAAAWKPAAQLLTALPTPLLVICRQQMAAWAAPAAWPTQGPSRATTARRCAMLGWPCGVPFAFRNCLAALHCLLRCSCTPPDPALALTPPPPPPPPPPPRQVCTYWLRGLCMKGDTCGFLHQFDPDRMPVCRNLLKFGACKEPGARHAMPKACLAARCC